MLAVFDGVAFGCELLPDSVCFGVITTEAESGSYLYIDVVFCPNLVFVRQ